MTIKELSFRSHRKLNEREIERDLKGFTDQYNEPRYQRMLKYVPTKNKRVKIAYVENRVELFFMVYIDDKVEGIFVFDKLDRRDSGPIAKALGVPPNTVMTPHVTLGQNLRGLGYAAVVYTIALKKKVTLISDNHTSAAAALWEKVAQYLKIPVRYFDEMEDEWVGEDKANGKFVIKVLTMHPLRP